jgi:hypothetical protein
MNHQPSTLNHQLNRRSWLALYLQGRRRRRSSVPAGPLPTVFLANPDYESDQGWYNIYFDLVVTLGAWPAASVEIWWAPLGNSFALLATVPSTTPQFAHYQAASGEADLFYQARYVQGVNVGPFSNQVEINISF